MGLEHERLPRDRVNASRRVLPGETFDVDEALAHADESLALASNVRIAGLERREPRVIVVVAMDEGGRTLEHPGVFGAGEEPTQALGDPAHSLLVGDERAYLRQ